MSRSTRERIVEAAEQLFAEQGFSATSLRNITAEAGVNLAAVNYHFGSKDELIRNVFARRLGPLNDERLAALSRAQRDAGEREPEIEKIIEAFVGPALRMSRDPGGMRFIQLFGRTLSQRNDDIHRMFTDQFRQVLHRFSEALGRALPELPGEEIFWRMMFMIGSMAHTMALADKLPEITGGVCKPTSVERLIERLVPFIAAGLRAPLSTATGEVGDDI